MHQAEIEIKNKAGEITYRQLHTAPASWAEITREHLLLWGSMFSTSLKLNDAKILLAFLLYKIPMRILKTYKKSDARPLANSIDFLFKKNQLSTWLIPTVRSGIFRYHGPKDRLANITIHEFELCERCYEQYINTDNREYLETLMGILYRPQRFWGIDEDIRIKLTTYGYVKRAKRFKKQPLAVKNAVFLNYEGCRNFLHSKYKDVFESGSGKAASGKKQFTPWPKIIESAANDIFGPMQTTEETNLHKFLSRLGTRIAEAREREKENKKSR